MAGETKEGGGDGVEGKEMIDEVSACKCCRRCSGSFFLFLFITAHAMLSNSGLHQYLHQYLHLVSCILHLAVSCTTDLSISRFSLSVSSSYPPPGSGLCSQTSRYSNRHTFGASNTCAYNEVVTDVPLTNFPITREFQNFATRTSELCLPYHTKRNTMESCLACRLEW